MILKLLMVISGTLMYTAGELYDKNLKYMMGIPISILACILYHSIWPLFCVLTYFIATEFGYGDTNPLTLLLGKRGAITFCGAALGLASFPIIGLWSILGMIISATAFYVISVLDDKNIVKEPFVGLGRGLFGTIMLFI